MSFSITLRVCFSFFIIGAKDRGYGHLAVTVSRDVPFAGAFTPRPATK